MGAMSDLNALNLQTGDIVGGYTLVSRLGAGAMGSVWRARDDGGQEYAMKILRDSLADDENADMDDDDVRERVTARERLRREAMALKKVDHPGVCGIVDMELDDSLAFIVTELIEGRNLRDDVKANGRYVGDDLERLARKLIDAVKAVHAAGIVHRDIKPTNVMVSASGPVLVDFGIAMTGGESHVTRTGLVMGTPGFIAPEIIDGEEADDVTDWWSVASVLAFAATGSPVFGTKPMMAVLERAARGNANLVGLPAGTMAAFRSALNPDRSKRCTPDELLHAIAVDALNPTVWQEAALDSGETEVVRPVDATGAGNPRLMWRDEPTIIAAVRNSAITRPNAPISRQPQPHPLGTGLAGAGNASTAILPPIEPSATMPLQSAQPPQPPQRSDVEHAASEHPVDRFQPTAAGGRPALRRLAGTSETPASLGTAAEPSRPPSSSAIPNVATIVIPNRPAPSVPRTTVMPDGMSQRTDAADDDPARTQTIGDLPTETLATDATQVISSPVANPDANVRTTRTGGEPEATQAMRPMPTTEPASRMADDTDGTISAELQPTDQQPPSLPPQDEQSQWQQPTFEAPSPESVAIRRGQYRSRGLLPLWALTIPVAVLAASLPLVAAMLAAVLLWLMIAAGFSTEAQLLRESRRGAERRPHDVWKRAASLPCHLVKALPFAALRAQLFAVPMSVMTLLATRAVGLPKTSMELFGRHWLSIPILDASPLSASGMTLAAGAAIGWMLSVFSANAATVRLGAGTLRGLKEDDSTTDVTDGDNGPQITRARVLRVICAALTAAAAIALGVNPIINWWPPIRGIW
ncbi:protein kinase [Bifidobacterium sp. 82T10]|uniref:non-specific serine/threonine protein kinase n=1 Tax=Bifidobacterium miconis TaxID=2834435 RepID=A0ABS6WFQ6_9BIFI|nr:serine/threonine-protein kinase [Bifidobacterium miconis]MBW3092777.1 protein kinase [Bifidobacterium miconis]